MISITGTWFLIQALLFDNHVTLSSEGVPTIIGHHQVPLTDGAPPPRVGLGQAVAAAQERIPGLEPAWLSFPSDAYSHVTVEGKAWYPLMYESASVNPYDGAVEATRLLGDRTGVEFVIESMRPLHTGDFGGIWIKLVWFVFGLLLSMMVLSGLLVWSKRTLIATAKELKRASPANTVTASLESSQ
ncbi:hypothetical protein D3C80_1257970 [compost metagenome]